MVNRLVKYQMSNAPAPHGGVFPIIWSWCRLATTLKISFRIMWARQSTNCLWLSTYYLCGNRNGDRVSSSMTWTTLARRRSVGIAKCAWVKPLARKINAIQLPGESSHITRRLEILENGILTKQGSHRMPQSAWRVAVSRTEPTHHAVHRTSHWGPRLVNAMSALLEITQCAPAQRLRGTGLHDPSYDRG